MSRESGLMERDVLKTNKSLGPDGVELAITTLEIDL